jgi:ribose transport system ATP-binding protein
VEELLLKAEGIYKNFPGVQALDNIDFDLRPGEVHVLLGENGAGKSTLVKILTGVYSKDSGTIRINGKEEDLKRPQDAMHLGISVIHQELNIAPHLDVAQNVYLGRLPCLGGRLGEILGWVDWPKVYQESKNVLEDLEIELDVHTLAGTIPTSKAQMVEIARALSMDSRIIFMDEPTSSISLAEQEELFRQIRQLKEKGVSVVYISHRLEEILKIGDRITVLRDGKKVGTLDAVDANDELLIQMIVGRESTNRYPKIQVEPGETILEVSNLCRKNVLKNINFKLRRGEILGFSGLVGSGRTELARAIFGVDPIDSGETRIFGKHVNINSPRDAMHYGIAFLTEDRKREGLFLNLSILTNLMSAAINCDRVTSEYVQGPSSLGFLNYKFSRQQVKNFVENLALKTTGLHQEAQFLSGGNQQKAVLAKWLMTKAQIFIFDEPTRGIDVGAKPEVYRLMETLAQNGAGVIMISSELPEVMAISDRIIVMSRGSISAEVPKSEATEELIMYYAATAPDKLSSHEFSN